MSEKEKEKNEARITAYLLGELDERESARVRRLLDESEDVRALAQELKAALGQVRGALGRTDYAALSLNDERRARIRAETATRAGRRPFTRIALRAAALLFIAAGVSFWVWSRPGGEELEMVGREVEREADEGRWLEEEAAPAPAFEPLEKKKSGRAADVADALGQTAQPARSARRETRAGGAILLPSVELEAVPIDEALQYVAELSVVHDPHGVGVRIAYGATEAPAARVPVAALRQRQAVTTSNITLSLRNVSVREAVEAIAQRAGLELVESEGGIRVVPSTP